MLIGQYLLHYLLNTKYWHQKFIDAVVSLFFFFFFLAPAAPPPPLAFESQTYFTTSLAPVAGVLLPKHTGFKQACQLDVLTPTQPPNGTLLATWSSGIHLQTALAGQRYTHPKPSCYAKERWAGDSSGYTTGHRLSQVFEAQLSDHFYLLGSTIHLFPRLDERSS